MFELLAWLCIWLSVVRNLSGHKAAVRSVELYPFGEFAASTSADHNVKVGWFKHPMQRTQRSRRK